VNIVNFVGVGRRELVHFSEVLLIFFENERDSRLGRSWDFLPWFCESSLRSRSSLRFTKFTLAGCGPGMVAARHCYTSTPVKSFFLLFPAWMFLTYIEAPTAR
jgi:hypothetical protein